MNEEKRNRFSLEYEVLFFLGMFNLMAAVFYSVMAVLFYGNFNLSSLWDLGGLVFTMMAPVAALVTFGIHHHYRSQKTVWVVLVGTGVTIVLLCIWQAEASRGWIH